MRLYAECLETRLAPSLTTLTSLLDPIQGSAPYGTPVVDASGNFFGVTQAGGPFGDGTIYEIKAGTGAVTTLAVFNGTNGAQPQGGLIEDSKGNLFGTTYGGGASGDGTVFELLSGSSTVKTLASFNGTNGKNPECTLLENSAGFLYGTTTGGGLFGAGTVFVISTVGGPLTTWATFNGANGATPIGGLIQDSAGNLYGTTYQGGAFGDGSVFKVQGETILSLASFSGSDGANPECTPLLDAGGNLYGTTSAGGASGYGTVFELLGGSPLVTTLASFNGSNGANPQTDLFEDASGNLFGAATYGGMNFTGPSTGYGTLFEVPSGLDTILTLAEFTGGADGANPIGGLLEDSAGNLAGAASSGTINYGTVFVLPSGSSTIGALAAFAGSVGANPYGALVEDAGGNLFGTTSAGGPNGLGTIIELMKGSSTVTTLAAFNGTNGANPLANLIADVSGNLFGTTSGGGASGDGTVFELASGSSTITTLASFGGTNGAYPNAGVIEDATGNLFGTTFNGGPTWNPANPQASGGTVFEIPSGKNTVTVLASFSGGNGMNPVGGLVEDKNGNLFGTTVYGGPSNNGTVFEVSSHGGPMTTLASFSGGNGANPTCTLIEDSSGNLFGTTFYGGPGYTGPATGNGTVFEVRSGGLLSTLAALTGTSGAHPYAGLLATSAGSFFGVAADGGPANEGTVFEVASSGTITPFASFSGANGIQPAGALIQDASNLFGSTRNGGLTDSGTLFEVPGAVPVITTTSLANGTVNQAGYNQTIAASGGSGTLTFGTIGTLPTGLTLSNTGVLSGTPSAIGTYTFTITATDSLGQTASMAYTVIIYPQATMLAVAAPGTATAGTAFNLTITAEDGAGNFAGGYSGTVTLSSSLGPDISPTSVAVTSGMATVPVTLTTAGGQTIMAAAPGLTSGSTSVTVSPGPFAEYLVATTGSSTVAAGAGLLTTVQAADRYGNPTSSYSGPATVTPAVSPGGSGASFPATVSVNSQGLGFFLVTFQKTGSYTVSVSSGSFTSNQASVTVAPGTAATLRFVVQPVNTPTGVTLPAVTVQVQDAYGNVITTDNSDVVTLGIASGTGGFTSGSTTTAPVHDGLAAFSHLTLVRPGSYALSAVVAGLYTGPSSNSFTIAPVQVAPGSFVGGPSGFSLQFNAPILVNSVTPVLYGQGFGSSAPAPSVTVTGPSGPVLGSLVVDAATNSITFVQTDTTTYVNTAPHNTPILPDGVYTVDLSSSAAKNGFQALNTGGGFLDGLGTGTPGSGDYRATFTVNAAAARDDVVWVPATADGPLQSLQAPGNNQQNQPGLMANGYPIYIDDSMGNVTSVQLTLNYNPAMLTVTGTTSNSAVPGSSFTLLPASTPGHAVLQFTGTTAGAAQLQGTAVPLGFLTATVPNSSGATPIYHGKDLLHLSDISLNSSIPAVAGDALHVVAYVGDADGNGSYSSGDAVLITRVLVSADTGFAAFPLVDPTIVADTDGSGFIPSDAALQANEAGVGFPTANLASPPIPPGANSTPIGNNVDPTLSVGRGAWSVGRDGQFTVTVPVSIDDPHPAGSTGLIRAQLALTYDPSQFTVSAADVQPGSLLAGGGWILMPTIDHATGQIGIALSGNTPITTPVGGSLVTIDFHERAGEPGSPGTIALVASVNPSGLGEIDTALQDAQGTFTLTIAPAL